MAFGAIDDPDALGGASASSCSRKARPSCSTLRTSSRMPTGSERAGSIFERRVPSCRPAARRLSAVSEMSSAVRGPDPEVGGRQASAAPGAARLLSTRIRPLLSSPSSGAPPCSSTWTGRAASMARSVVLADVNDDLVGLYHVVCATARRGHRRAEGLDQGHRADPARTTTASATPASTRRVVRLRAQHARWWEHYTPQLGGDADLSQSHGIQRLVSGERRRRFNVPIGRYVKPPICDAEQLRRASISLDDPASGSCAKPSRRLLADGWSGDFVYLDPPYAPVGRVVRLHELHGRRILAG